MIRTVVVGHGLAGRYFHCPLIKRQPELSLHGIVARDNAVRTEAQKLWNVRGYASLDQALEDPAVELLVIATPHKSHADLAIRTLDAGRHCVVDKVMALSTPEADAMIAARDRSGAMLSVFHNRRWDWDFVTVREILSQGLIGRPLLIENAVCRQGSPRGWKGKIEEAGTILHDWGVISSTRRCGLGWGHAAGLSAGCWRAPGKELIAAATGGSLWSSTTPSSRPRPAASAGSTAHAGGSSAVQGVSSSTASIPRKTHCGRGTSTTPESLKATTESYALLMPPASSPSTHAIPSCPLGQLLREHRRPPLAR